MRTRYLLAIFTTATLLLFSCVSGDEAAARTALRVAFQEAQRGEIESILERVAPENQTKAMLLALRDIDEERYRATLAELGEAMESRLAGAELFIRSVTLTDGRATLRCLVIKDNQEWESVAELLLRDGRWLLGSLPLFPAVE